MKTIQIHQYGGPEVLQRIDIAGRYALDNVGEADAAYEERRMVGKPVLDLV